MYIFCVELTLATEWILFQAALTVLQPITARWRWRLILETDYVKGMSKLFLLSPELDRHTSLHACRITDDLVITMCPGRRIPTPWSFAHDINHCDWLPPKTHSRSLTPFSSKFCTMSLGQRSQNIISWCTYSHQEGLKTEFHCDVLRSRVTVRLPAF